MGRKKLAAQRRWLLRFAKLQRHRGYRGFRSTLMRITEHIIAAATRKAVVPFLTLIRRKVLKRQREVRGEHKLLGFHTLKIGNSTIVISDDSRAKGENNNNSIPVSFAVI